MLTYTNAKPSSVKELEALAERQPGENGQKATSADEYIVDDQSVNSWQTAGQSAHYTTNGIADTNHRYEEHSSRGLDACQLGSICTKESTGVTCFFFFHFFFFPFGTWFILKMEHCDFSFFLFFLRTRFNYSERWKKYFLFLLEIFSDRKETWFNGSIRYLEHTWRVYRNPSSWAHQRWPGSRKKGSWEGLYRA